MFHDKDLRQLEARGIHKKLAEEQILSLRKGFPFLQLSRAATINQGIKKLSDKELLSYIQLYDKEKELSRLKFVPASGAATRMFKALFEFDEGFRQSNNDPLLIKKEAYKQVKECFDNLEKFAFFGELEAAVSIGGSDVSSAVKKRDYHLILNALLGEEGMNYGNLPKGLLTFHKYPNGTRTAVEEHLVEGAGYAANANGRVSIHLTVSPEHQPAFEKLLELVKGTYEMETGLRFDITYSVQKPSTDTLAIDDKQEPFRENDGSLHFRPGGHGALLENLNEMDADLVFIKNIDNVAPDHLKPDTHKYKKALAGLLISLQVRIHKYLAVLDKTAMADEAMLNEISDFLSLELGTSVSKKLLQQPEQAAKILHAKLNRPIRVCGMVKNLGEPGGGPFWTTDSEGTQTLQIVESSQVNQHDPEQAALLSSATHFNPVDLVCGIRDYKGRKFRLMDYRDEGTGFISKKFRNGKPLKALELPGLWNGSMAFWNTVFVEVPVSTFSPVKTVHDLLRKEHQSTL